MKTTVRVLVSFTRQVELEVEHDEDLDPCDLTDREELQAVTMAENSETSEFLYLEIVRVEVRS